jgi:hypothetical protein
VRNIDAPVASEATAAPVPPPVVNRASKLRDLAEGMADEIAHKFADRLANTPKRRREAGAARNEGARLQRTQEALRALAAAHDAGAVPPELGKIASKKSVYDLVGTVINHSGGYYDAGVDTGKPSSDTPEARALWALLSPPDPAKVKAEELRRKVEALQFASIPGYFPTPAPVIARMIELADFPVGPFDMLEPEAGSGAILDAVSAARPDACLFAFERHCSLRDVLEMKGYAIDGADFLEAEPVPTVDRVLMNPPFENMQDVDHVRHAFKMLRPGGVLVSVMSTSPFWRDSAKAAAFREWFESVDGEQVELPSGSFKASGTGVETTLVKISR